MTKSCCAYNCTNRFKKKSGRVFHRFPFHNYELLTKWILAIRRTGFFPTVHTYICSDHFSPECYREGNKLKKNSVPTLFKFPDHIKKKLRALKPKPQHPVKNLPLQNMIINQPGVCIVKSNSVKPAHVARRSPKKFKRRSEAIREKKDSKVKQVLTAHKLQISQKLKPEYLAIIQNLKEKFNNIDVAQTLEGN